MNVKKELEKIGVCPSKRLGQNFLFDENIARKIVDALITNSLVIEIGPGLGILSKYILERFYSPIFIEKDPLLYKYFKSNYPDSNVILGDATKFNFGKMETCSIISNLPYSISKNIIRVIISFYPHIEEAVLMLQKEVVTRLIAHSHSKDYGVFTILIGVFYTVEKLFNVSKNVFYPKPEVDSSVIRLIKRDPPLIMTDERQGFISFIKSIFISRRKKIANNLGTVNIRNNKLCLRAEELNIIELIELYRELKASSK